MDQNKIQEMQMLEQTLQNLLMQKQAFQMEFTETESALKEVEKLVAQQERALSRNVERVVRLLMDFLYTDVGRYRLPTDR